MTGLPGIVPVPVPGSGLFLTVHPTSSAILKTSNKLTIIILFLFMNITFDDIEIYNGYINIHITTNKMEAIHKIENRKAITSRLHLEVMNPSDS
jgi:hypothetical protein